MAKANTSKSNLEKARAAAGKPARFGEDIDLKNFQEESEPSPYQKDPSRLPKEARDQMLTTGVLTDNPSQRSGTYIQTDNTPVHASISQDGVEIMAVKDALNKYDWVSDYWWKAVSVDTDKFTASVEINEANGYFIRSLPGQKTVFPVQACLYLSKANLSQKVHNIIIAEENSELHIITGCTTSPHQEAGLHLGVSEFYIKPGAKVTFTMIHNWSPKVDVRPRTGVIIEDNALFMSNYIIMKPVQSLQTYPKAYCVGENATCRFNSVLVAPPGSSMDTGSAAILDGKGARGGNYFPGRYHRRRYHRPRLHRRQ